MNHRWDEPDKFMATCIKCGVTRIRANWRYCEKWFYSYEKNGIYIETLVRPKCTKNFKS